MNYKPTSIIVALLGVLSTTLATNTSAQSSPDFAIGNRTTSAVSPINPTALRRALERRFSPPNQSVDYLTRELRCSAGDSGVGGGFVELERVEPLGFEVVQSVWRQALGGAGKERVTDVKATREGGCAAVGTFREVLEIQGQRERAKELAGFSPALIRLGS